MTTLYCIAYKNEYTTNIHAKQNSACGGWVRKSTWVSFVEARRIFETIQDDFGLNTAVAIFSDSGDEAWYNKRPRYLHNHHVLFSDTAMRQAFGGLINAADSGYF